MVGPINSAVASALFGRGGATATEPLGVGADILTALVRARAGVDADAKTASADPKAPLAPVWTPGISPRTPALLQRALDGKSFFDTQAKLYSDLGASGDYRRLFALYTGLSSMQALAERAGEEGVSSADKAQATRQFSRGMSELQKFFATERFEDVRFAQGDRVDAAQTSLALQTKSEDYTTGLIHRGSLADVVRGLAANARFDVVATPPGGSERRVAIDLAEMGSIPRSLGSVISFVNSRLSAAGAASRLEAVDQTPKTSTINIGGRAITSRYTGPKQYALQLDVRAGERVALEPVAATPAFYAVGATNGGARLIKLSDVDGAAGQPVRLARPAATADPIGPNVASGWLGPGAPYSAAPAGAYTHRSNALLSAGDNNFEAALRAPGEAVLKLAFADGRVLSLSTAWRADDVETWRQRSGESGDRAIADDLAERLTQMLHEQGVAAGVEVWEDNGELGFSVMTGDLVTVSGLAISGRNVSFTRTDPPGMVGGLRDGVFARRYAAPAVAGSSDLFEGMQTFLISTTNATHSINIDGGTDGVDGATLLLRLNQELVKRGVAASASFHDNGGALELRLDGLHDLSSFGATINDVNHAGVLAAPSAWASGGLPAASAGQPFGDALRFYAIAGGPPLLTHTGALDIAVVVATATGNKTINVAVSALERANDPDPSPGTWSAAFQARLDVALNTAGVYVSAADGALGNWSVAEGAGQRLVSVSINGAPQTLQASTPALGFGGAFSVERSFTSASASTGVSDDVAALVGDQNVSITFDTIWGARTVSAALSGGDPRTLESAALRLNEALAAQGYDLGVEAQVLSGGGAGLRIISGASHSIRSVSGVNLGGQARAVTLDPIDSASRADDPVGAARVAERASRGAAATETISAQSTLTAPSANAAGWFPGRAFDVSVGAGAKVATARAVATGSDGAVYVLADLNGDSATSPIRGSRDVALFKYDSVGKLVFSEMLGAAQSASGFALAVSSDGKVAIAGAIEGALTGADAARGGTDSFVTLLDASGKEVWTQRRAANANDEARAVAFAPDGSVIVAGKTESALGGAIAMGGADAYVRGFSATGAELFTRQFGTGSDDAATALLVRANGGGALEIFTGGVENQRGIVRRFTYASGVGLSAATSRDIGYFHTGAINAIAADGASLYVGGEVGAERLDLGVAARAAISGKEGFVARLDAGLASAALDRASYLGSAQDDAVRSIALVAGAVYAAGVSGGVIAGQASAKTQSAFLTRLDANGEAAWTRTFNSAGGAFALNGLAVDAVGASPLDVLGLPRGVVAANEPGVLTSRSALRAGDEFRVGGEGKRLTTIQIGANDTLASLVGSINRALGSSGRAEIVRENGAERLKVSAREGQAVRIEAGRPGANALDALGLTPGIVAVNTTARGSLRTFGLGLAASDLKLESKADIAKTNAELSAAISLVRQAYDLLLYPNAKEQTPAEKALEARRQNVGAAPEYLTAQLANYQAALARLRGG